MKVSLLLAAGFLTGLSVSSQSGFEDITEKSGVKFRNQNHPTKQKYLIETMVGGVAMLDYNGDGALDLFFVNGARLTESMKRGQQPDKSVSEYWNRLYRNNSDGTFTDVTEKAGLQGKGYSMGVAVADFDNDGHPDIYVTGWDGNTLYRNRGDGTFEDVTTKAGVRGSGWSTGAAFVDVDRDGHLDLVVARYMEWGFHLDIYCGEKKAGHRSYCHPDHYQPTTHLLFRNNGNGTFTDISKASGIGIHPGKGLGVAINDFNDDGWPDIAIANDAVQQQLFLNNKGKFTEAGLELGIGYDDDGRAFAGMGIDFTDYDNDGRPDIFINALANQRYALFHHTGSAFEYISRKSGLSEASSLHSGWGAKFFDFDNDGWKDLFVAQGHVTDNIELTQPNIRYLEPPMLLKNNRGKLTDISRNSGSIFSKALASRGAAFGDLNNDGYIDIAINALNGPAVILKNRGGNNQWLGLDLKGTKSNRDAIGAVVKVVSLNGVSQIQMVSTAGSYLSASDRRLFFGLGKDTEVKQVEIRWPNGKTQKLGKLAVNKLHQITEPSN